VDFDKGLERLSLSQGFCCLLKTLVYQRLFVWFLGEFFSSVGNKKSSDEEELL
jgi:hypothetical protein